MRPIHTTAFMLLVCATTGAAQTTVTINVPGAQVVYTTLRAGAYANTNQGNDLETKTSSDMSVTRRAMLKFDTNTIPLGTSIASAKLTVTVGSAAGATRTRHVAAYQITQSWTETEATWNRRRVNQPWLTAGGDLGRKLDTQVVSNASGTRVSFDVTPLVSQVVSGALGSSRYTRIMLVDVDPADGESRRIYHTPNDANVALRPTLTVTLGTVAPPPPPPSPAPGPSTTLRVLAYNIHHNGIGSDGVNNPNRIADLVAAANPDVVSLEEVESGDGYYTGDGTALYQHLLEARTGITWYALDIQKYGSWTAAGQRDAILSKYPFISTARFAFSTATAPKTVGNVTIAVNGRTVNISSNHFAPYSTGAADRLVQAQELVSYLQGFAEDRITVGDFNDSPTTPSIKAITAGGYVDAWTAGVKAGVQQSAPDNASGITHSKSRIDFVFYSSGSQYLTLTGIAVLDTRDANGHTASDHEPVLATFSVR